MSRYIDADDAINVFTNRLFETLKTNLLCVTAEENQICLETCYKVAKYEIDTIPTAYDVEKVLKQLKEAETDVSKLGTYAIPTDKAFKIALKGGVK